MAPIKHASTELVFHLAQPLTAVLASASGMMINVATPLPLVFCSLPIAPRLPTLQHLLNTVTASGAESLSVWRKRERGWAGWDFRRAYECKSSNWGMDEAGTQTAILRQQHQKATDQSKWHPLLRLYLMWIVCWYVIQHHNVTKTTALIFQLCGCPLHFIGGPDIRTLQTPPPCR